MVCPRCIQTVKEQLEKLDLQVEQVQLGEATVSGEVEEKARQISEALAKHGFELLYDRKTRLIEHIKTLVIDLIHHKQGKTQPAVNFSDYLADTLNTDYHYLSTLFSASEGITIEKFIILQKVERVKELLTYGELSVSEIAFQLGYSSVHHLSNQFKKVTGLTPSQFKDSGSNLRTPLDQIAGAKTR
jgi:AraC-like DNA-binding protein